MDARLDTFSTKLYQVNTCVSCIAWQQACIGGFTASPSPSPSPQALEDKDSDDDKDKDDSSSSDEEMTTS